MTISEVSAKYDISSDTLRYYERIGVLPHVPRDASGKRNYNEACCTWVETIKCFRSAGVQIEALIEYVALSQMEGDYSTEQRQILLEQRGLLEEKICAMQASLKLLDHKIEKYSKKISASGV